VPGAHHQLVSCRGRQSPRGRRAVLHHSASRARTCRRGRASGGRSMSRIPGRRDAPPSSPLGFARAGVGMSSAPAGARRPTNKVTRLGITLGRNTLHVCAMVRTGAGRPTARLPGSASRNADSCGPAEAPTALRALVEQPCRTAMFQNLYFGSGVRTISHLTTLRRRVETSRGFGLWSSH